MAMDTRTTLEIGALIFVIFIGAASSFFSQRRYVRLFIKGNDGVRKRRWGKLSKDGRTIDHKKKTYIRDTLARESAETFMAELGLTKGTVEAYTVFEGWSQPVIFLPHAVPIHDFTETPNAAFKEEFEKVKEMCVTCSKSPYALTLAHRVHEFKNNKVEQGLVEAAAKEAGQGATPVQLAILILAGIACAIMLALAYQGGLFNLETWSTPRGK